MTMPLRRKLLRFTTAKQFVFKGGLRTLNPPFTVIPKDDECDPDSLFPVAMTCVHLLKLPQYSSIEIMRAKILTAIDDGASFGWL
jgi:E3 ubiquitin-protein ligase TRIP12